MLKLSDIKSSDEELRDYYAQLRTQHVTPAWIGGGISLEPRSKAVPHVWRWRDLRPQAMRAAELVGTEQAERRGLRLTNPELPGVSARVPARRGGTTRWLRLVPPWNGWRPRTQAAPSTASSSNTRTE